MAGQGTEWPLRFFPTQTIRDSVKRQRGWQYSYDNQPYGLATISEI